MAVYTHLTNEEIGTLLTQHYQLGAFDFAVGIAAGVENSNYLVATRDAQGREQKHILTLYEKRVEAAELPFFLGLMQHLAARGFPCPQPIAMRDGALFTHVAGRPAAMVSFVPGQSRSVIRPTHAAAVGATLAQLHAAADGFAMTRANRLSLAGWRGLQQKLGAQLEAVAPGLAVMVQEELAWLSAQWPAAQALPRGVIHADLFPDNVFFQEAQVSGVIDFYFACEDWLAYDLAIAMNAWCFEPDGTFHDEKAQRMVAAYDAVRPLNAAEKAALPLLLRGAALRFLLTRAHDWIHRVPGAQVVVLDPLEYVAKLRFHQATAINVGGARA